MANAVGLPPIGIEANRQIQLLTATCGITQARLYLIDEHDVHVRTAFRYQLLAWTRCATQHAERQSGDQHTRVPQLQP